MSFEIILQTNTSEINSLDKTLVTIATLTGTLRDNASIIDPIVLVEADLVDLKFVNYATIDTFGRSYFVNNITSVRTGLVELNCHVDVLSSFKTEIRANKGIIFRQEEDWNLYLNDGVIEVYQNPIVVTRKFPNGFEGESYVLILAGRNGSDPDNPSPGVLPGAGGNSSATKTPWGLAEYATAQLGKPYWFGTFGQTADQALLDNRKAAYPDYYTATDFPSQFGQRVHDCVGLIKGYRWSNSPTSPPTYNASQDVSVSGLYAQCSSIRGTIGDTKWTNTYQYMHGVCLFNQDFSHTGVSMGDGLGKVVEARGHAYGVVESNITDVGRTWKYWGVPDWMLEQTGIPVN